MNESRYKKLIEKLDKEISRLQGYSCDEQVVNPKQERLKITEDLDIESLSEGELPLVHSMLHMFHHNKNGAELSSKTIEKLHKDVVKRLKNHKKFDRLDDGRLYKN